MTSLPSVYTLKDILFDDYSCRHFLVEQHAFYEALLCPKCGRQMDRRLERFTFQCPSGKCRTEFSMRKHTFFFGSMLKCCEILYLGYLWLNRVSVSSAIGITGHSSRTVSIFYSHFRQLVASSLDENMQVIGGLGIIVEVDETKMGKRKYNRGHRVDGVWVVAGVERTKERRVFLAQVESRDKETLMDIIGRHVSVGSIVHTDLWRGYSSLSTELGLEHKTVNHSQCFKDKSTGVHTNFIEGTNNALKIRIAPRCRTKDCIDEHLSEFIWRRTNEDNLWNAFISAVRDVHYDCE
jgi:transposase-like protein